MIIKFGLTQLIVLRLIIAILILLCTYNLNLNPNFFGFAIVLLALSIITSALDIVRITETEVEFERKRLIPFMTKIKRIKFNDIKSIEFIEGNSSILVLFLSFLFGPTGSYKQQDKFIITLKSNTVYIRERFGKLDKFKEVIELIQKKINAR